MNQTSGKTKVVALYLPQYYETEYNDEWWGEGYTDWTACKQAKPLFTGHDQPRVPKGQRYHDLSVKENIKWQIETAKTYGIDGFAIYQYYSCGSKLLEVPTEIIRDNRELDMPFFLYWANMPWRKMWFGQDRTILWEQNYGHEKEWKDQFDYCLTFFKDDRYMKIDGKPIYVIYMASNFKEADEFIDAWNRWAREEGFPGIYFVKTLGSHDGRELGKFSGAVAREPNYTFAFDEGLLEKMFRVGKTRFVDWINRAFLLRHGTGIVMLKYSYDKVWKRILARKVDDETVFLGAFTDWDNSPRKSYNSIIMRGATPQKFGQYFSQLLRKAEHNSSAMIVINAWNEWAEGAYLEPDEKNGYAYLKAIKAAKSETEARRPPVGRSRCCQ